MGRKANVADLVGVSPYEIAPSQGDRKSLWRHYIGVALDLFRTAPRTGRILTFNSPDDKTEFAIIECAVDDVEAALNTQLREGWHLADSGDRNGQQATLRFWRLKPL